MKNTALKLSMRSVGTSFRRWVALFLIVMLSVGFYAGLKLCRPAFWQACRSYVTDQHLYDYQLLSSIGFDEDDVKSIAAADGVEKAEGGFTQDMLVTIDSTDGAYKFLSLPGGDESLNMPTVVAGRMPESSGECLVAHRAFDESAIGSTVTLSDHNDSDSLDRMKRRTFTIVGTANSPLYLSDSLGATTLGSGSLDGYIYIPEEDFDMDRDTEISVAMKESASFEIYSDDYDNFIDDHKDAVQTAAEKAVDADYEKILSDIMDEANDRIDRQAAQLNLTIPHMTRDEAVKEASDQGVDEPDIYVLTRSENAGYESFRSDTSIINAIANVFPIFFILIALLVCVTTMTRMVSEERTQIGTLKALGYSDFSITMKYMLYACSATVLGWAAGYAGGTVFLPQIFWSAYHTLYDFTALPYVFDGVMAAVTLAVSLAAIIASVWLSCRSELLSQPAVLIRPRAAKPGRRILLEHFRHLWRHLSFLRKATFRNMARYKVRMLMMVIGIGCCTALIVTAFGVRDSMIDVGTMQFDSIQTYQMTASADKGDAGAAQDALDKTEGIAETLPAISTLVDTRAGSSTRSNAAAASSGEEAAADSSTRSNAAAASSGKEAAADNSTATGNDDGSTGSTARMSSVTMYCFENGADADGFWHFESWDGQTPLSYPGSGEVLISRRMAQKLGVSAGDKVVIEDTGGDVPVTAELTVSGVFRNYIANYAFISRDTWQKYFSDDSSFMDQANTILLKTAGDTAMTDSLLHRVNQTEGVTSVTSLQDTLDQVNESLSVLDYIIWLIIGLAGALAFIVIFNLTNINIAERSREIATVQVLGFYPRETRSYVLWENLVLSVLASIIGLPTGYLFCSFVISRILIDGMTFPVIIHPESYVYSLALSVLFAVIVNFFMRRQISRINMAESLKAVE